MNCYKWCDTIRDAVLQCTILNAAISSAMSVTSLFPIYGHLALATDLLNTTWVDFQFTVPSGSLSTSFLLPKSSVFLWADAERVERVGLLLNYRMCAHCEQRVLPALLHKSDHKSLANQAPAACLHPLCK